MHWMNVLFDNLIRQPVLREFQQTGIFVFAYHFRVEQNVIRAI